MSKSKSQRFTNSLLSLSSLSYQRIYDTFIYNFISAVKLIQMLIKVKLSSGMKSNNNNVQYRSWSLTVLGSPQLDTKCPPGCPAIPSSQLDRGGRIRWKTTPSLSYHPQGMSGYFLGSRASAQPFDGENVEETMLMLYLLCSVAAKTLIIYKDLTCVQFGGFCSRSLPAEPGPVMFLAKHLHQHTEEHK
ncbi:hypothetical protein WISP_143604 [Willisornis vidua]|uniref:Uncharacterized protein n=1 Tax=Willisornis vidua TaxID=1566151 RepID=A0ABQ9CLC6_9PASS|nr:hypothetical protein WISP_143604 [Willisornis vidua]